MLTALMIMRIKGGANPITASADMADHHLNRGCVFRQPGVFARGTSPATASAQWLLLPQSSAITSCTAPFMTAARLAPFIAMIA